MSTSPVSEMVSLFWDSVIFRDRLTIIMVVFAVFRDSDRLACH